VIDLRKQLNNSYWKINRRFIGTDTNGFISASGYASFDNFKTFDLRYLLYNEILKVKLRFEEGYNEFIASKKYIFSFNLKLVKVFFFSNSELGELFLNLKLLESENRVYKFNGTHQCVSDLYEANYNFYLDDNHRLKNFNINYKVLGRKKDFTISSIYSESDVKQYQRFAIST
jgi:Family of unknown function (DUF6314)